MFKKLFLLLLIPQVLMANSWVSNSQFRGTLGITGTLTPASGSISSTAWNYGASTFTGSGVATFTGQSKFADGSAAAPSIHIGTNTGFYNRSAANQLGFGVNGTEVGFTNGDWTLGSGTSSEVTLKGQTLNFNGAATAATTYSIRHGVATGIANISGGSSTTNGANIQLYGGSHASAGLFEVRSGSTVNMSVTGAGVATITGALTVGSHVTVKTGSELRLNNPADTFYTGFKSGAALASKIWTLPLVDGSSAQVLKTDGAGTLGWASVDTAPNSGELILSVGNGHGATNTKIRRFTTIEANTATAIMTYADAAGPSATDGMSVTILEAGLYAIDYSDRRSSGASSIGISVNSASLATSVFSIAAATKKAMATTPGADLTGFVSVVIRLAVSDVVRAHTSGDVDQNDANVRFSMRKVGN